MSGNPFAKAIEKKAAVSDKTAAGIQEAVDSDPGPLVYGYEMHTMVGKLLVLSQMGPEAFCAHLNSGREAKKLLFFPESQNMIDPVLVCFVEPADINEEEGDEGSGEDGKQ